MEDMSRLFLRTVRHIVEDPLYLSLPVFSEACEVHRHTIISFLDTFSRANDALHRLDIAVEDRYIDAAMIILRFLFGDHLPVQAWTLIPTLLNLATSDSFTKVEAEGVAKIVDGLLPKEVKKLVSKLQSTLKKRPRAQPSTRALLTDALLAGSDAAASDSATNWLELFVSGYVNSNSQQLADGVKEFAINAFSYANIDNVSFKSFFLSLFLLSHLSPFSFSYSHLHSSNSSTNSQPFITTFPSPIRFNRIRLLSFSTC